MCKMRNLAVATQHTQHTTRHQCLPLNSKLFSHGDLFSISIGIYRSDLPPTMRIIDIFWWKLLNVFVRIHTHTHIFIRVQRQHQNWTKKNQQLAHVCKLARGASCKFCEIACVLLKKLHEIFGKNSSKSCRKWLI